MSTVFKLRLLAAVIVIVILPNKAATRGGRAGAETQTTEQAETAGAADSGHQQNARREGPPQTFWRWNYSIRHGGAHENDFLPAEQWRRRGKWPGSGLGL